MEKKNYVKPQQKVVVLMTKNHLLAGSAAEAASFGNGGDIWGDDSYDTTD